MQCFHLFGLLQTFAGQELKIQNSYVQITMVSVIGDAMVTLEQNMNQKWTPTEYLIDSIYR